MAERKPRKKPARVDRPSTIDRMPKDIQDEIYRLRFAEGRHLDEIIAHLKGMGSQPPSRTALGRHIKSIQHEIDEKVDANLRAISPVMQTVQQLNGAVITSLAGAAPDAMLGGLEQMVMTLLFQFSLQSMKAAGASPEDLEENPELAQAQMDPLSANRIARTIGTFVQTRRHLQALQIEADKEADRKKDRDAQEKDAKALAKAEADSKAAADEVVKVAKQRGLSAETIDEFYDFVVKGA
jgi:hypothetical protein